MTQKLTQDEMDVAAIKNRLKDPRIPLIEVLRTILSRYPSIIKKPPKR